MHINWHLKTFDALDAKTLYDLLKLRQDVFVLEQQCLYPDIDGLDPVCLHRYGVKDGAIVAYLRIIPPSHHPKGLPAIGRVVVACNARGHRLARTIMEQALNDCRTRYPSMPVFLSAQTYLIDFYRSLGFEAISAPYLEDGIEHIDMRQTETR